MYLPQEKGHAVEGVPNQDTSAPEILYPLSGCADNTGEISADAKAKQRGLILDALRAGPLSTLEARERHGVLHAAGRVLELRKAGFKIETKMKTKVDDAGRPHRCGVYVLAEGTP